MKKRLILLLSIALSVMMMFIGCSPKPTKAEVDVTFDKDAAVTLTLGVSNDPNEKLIAQAFADAYKGVYPAKTVEVTTIPGDYVNGLVFDYNAGIAPDMMWMGDDNLSYLADLEVLANLSQFMEKEKEVGVDNPLDLTLYYDSMLKMGKNKQVGDYFMLPRDYNKNVIFFNKKLLTEIGVAYPTDNNWDWADFMTFTDTVSKKLIAKGNTMEKGYEALEGANLDWKAIVYPMLKSFGGTFLDNEGKAAFKTDAMTKTLENIGAFAQSGYSQAIGQTGARGSFVAGKAAMYVGSRPTVGALLANKIDFGVVSYPKTGNKNNDGEYTNALIGSGTTGYGMNSTTTKPGEAWNFLKFIIGQEGQLAFSKTGSCVPVLKSMAEDVNAEWRKQPSMDNLDAFVLYPKRDCVIDIFNSAPAEKESMLMGNYAGMIMDVTNGSRSAVDARDHYFEEIAKALNKK